jgi:hypothetical protein
MGNCSCITDNPQNKKDGEEMDLQRVKDLSNFSIIFSK